METLIDTAVHAGKYRALISALQTASFIGTLRTRGRYTLFAPTDAAFRRIAPGALDALLRDTGRLYALLTHHVVSGIVMAKDVTSGRIKTIGGASLVATRAEGHVFVNGVSISRADIEASNGVMHVVDQLILPRGEEADTRFASAGPVARAVERWDHRADGSGAGHSARRGPRPAGPLLAV